MIINATGRVMMRGLMLLHRAVDHAIMRRGQPVRSSDRLTSDYVYGQANEPYCSMRIGAVGNGKSHGCGPFAVYNTLLALNGRADLSDIIWYLERVGGINLGGLFGTNPEAMAGYLQMDITYLPKGIDGRIRDIGILMYYWRRGAKIGFHYVMIKAERDGYLIYNEHSNDMEPRRYPSIEEWALQKGYVLILVISED